MDQKEFDDLVRRLARESSRRRVFGQGLGVAGTALAAASGDIAAKVKGGKKKDQDGKRRGKDARAGEPGAAPDVQACIATGKKCRKKKNGKVKDRCAECCSQLSDGKICICRNAGGACSADANCCAGSCVDGTCADGPQPACRELGAACKNVAGGCCEGLVCGSGQGGDGDVACYVPKTGRCQASADCVYGLTCTNGLCSPPPPVPLAQPCAAAVGQGCTTPGAVCTAYDGGGAPLGTYCTLPLGTVCTGDKDCTCYKCGPENTASSAARHGRDGDRLVCCGPVGYPCQSDRNCCGDTTCANGRCQFLS